ncbi:MAG: hypothetical protein WBC44_01155 [Planctomycetaceae bacterium]
MNTFLKPTGRVRWVCVLVTFFLAVLALAATARADDRVTVRTPSGVGKVVLVGQILDWTGGVIKIRSGDDVHEIVAERVVNVETPRLKSHLDGLKAFENGNADEAATQLNAALAEDTRQWMRREILAVLVRVALARGDRAQAVSNFLAIESSDPATQHLRLIPLDWSTTPPEPFLAAEARLWLRPGRSDNAKLLAASILLFDEKSGDQAAEILNELASQTKPHLFTLARAQLWRRQLVDGRVPIGEIERWEDRLKEIPEPFRGGPYSLIGRAWSAAGDPERAAAALLWLPLVYDADPSLAARSAVQAGDELTKIGRTGDAIVLYREVLTRFPSTTAAKDAQARIDRIRQAQPTQSKAAVEINL